MSFSDSVLIGLGLCMLIVPLVCIMAARRFYRSDGAVAEVEVEAEDEVLELALDQLSFDQLAKEPAPAKPSGDNVEFGIKPERIEVSGGGSRLECQLGLLNNSKTTLITVRISSDVVIYRSAENQAVRPSGPGMRQDTLARVDPGEKLVVPAKWTLPQEFLPEISASDGRSDKGGVFLLIRVRVLGANLPPRSQYFLIGHLLPSTQLVPIRNRPEALENLGMVKARKQ